MKRRYTYTVQCSDKELGFTFMTPWAADSYAQKLKHLRPNAVVKITRESAAGRCKTWTV